MPTWAELLLRHCRQPDRLDTREQPQIHQIDCCILILCTSLKRNQSETESGESFGWFLALS
jgi:hypothetical protein